MTTTNVIEMPREQNPNDIVRAAVRALFAAAGLTQKDAAPIVGINHKTLWRRLSTSGDTQPFTAGEIAKIAKAFRLNPGDLFEPPRGFFGPVVSDVGSEGWEFESLRARTTFDDAAVLPFPGDRRKPHPAAKPRRAA
jgi:DNA-binding Xre family transcriptional regulator